MPAASTAELTAARCQPCEGGIPKMTAGEAREQLPAVPEWTLAEDAASISRTLNTGDFVTAVGHINRIGDLAEAEQHHPDLHLTGYRHLKIVLTTHAIGGLSANDFILAAKIDEAIA